MLWDKTAWEILTRTQQAEYCRAMAKELLDRASLAHPSHEGAYQALATHWLVLADEIERNYETPSALGSLKGNRPFS
jgi:hypothetical protein